MPPTRRQRAQKQKPTNLPCGYGCPAPYPNKPRGWLPNESYCFQEQMVIFRWLAHNGIQGIFYQKDKALAIVDDTGIVLRQITCEEAQAIYKQYGGHDFLYHTGIFSIHTMHSPTNTHWVNGVLMPVDNL